MKLLVGFLKFWNDLIIGDCWQIAAGIALFLGSGIVLLRFHVLPTGILSILLGTGVVVLVPLIVVFEARAAARISRTK